MSCSLHRYPWVKRWEVWNEYIGSFVEPGSPATTNKPLYYTQMIAQVKETVKGTYPDVLLGGGAAEDIPMPSFDKEFALGLCQSSDAVVIHPCAIRPFFCCPNSSCFAFFSQQKRKPNKRDHTRNESLTRGITLETNA